MGHNQRKGKHTWNLSLQYHRCPQCGKILESREEYTYHLGKYEKKVTCDRCHLSFTLIKPHRPKFGPLWDGEWRLFG